MRRRPVDPKYDRYQRELSECQRLGLNYVATEESSHLILMADDMRLDGNYRAAQMLRTAAMLSARSQAVTLVAVRRATISMKPKKVRRAP